MDRDELVGDLLREVSKQSLRIERIQAQMSTGVRLAGLVVGGVVSLFGFLVVTTIRNEEQLKDVRARTEAHVASGSHREVSDRVSDLDAQLRELTVLLKASQVANDERIDEILEALPKRWRRPP